MHNFERVEAQSHIISFLLITYKLLMTGTDDI